MPVHEYEVELPCSAEGLFQFLTQPANILKVSHPDLGIVFEQAPVQIEHGTTLDFKMITFGRVIEMSHEIITFTPHSVVVEDQVKGPMKSWQHTHEYVDTGNGMVKKDRIDFELPGGLIGMLLSEDKIIDQLEDGFHYRHQQLSSLIEAGQIQ